MDIKWIKLSVSWYKSDDIQLIRKLPDGDTIALMFVMLLAMAGDRNEDGCIPYSDEDLSALLDIPLDSVRTALRVMEDKGMIDTDDGMFHVTNWAKYQNIESMERYREKNREYQRRYREKHKSSDRTEEKENPSDPEEKVVATITLIKSDGVYNITESEVEKYKELYPAIDVMQEIRNMVGWCDANPKNRKTRTGINRFINSWLARAQNRAPRKGTGTGQRRSAFDDA